MKLYRFFILIGGLLVLAAGVCAETRLPASLEWSREVTLTLPESGKIEDVFVQTGSQVKAGQLLLKLDNRTRSVYLEATKASLEAAKSEHHEAQRELDRVSELYNQTLISEHEMEIAKALFSRAEAKLKHAGADMTVAAMALEDSRLHAPFGGIVSERLVEAGQYIVNRCQAEPLLRLADISQMHALAAVTATQLDNLRKTTKLSVETAGKTYVGKLLPGLQVQQNAQQTFYTVWVQFKPDEMLYPGQTAVLVAE